VAFFSYIYLQRGKTTRAIALAEQVIVEASEKEPFFNLQLAKMFGGAALAKQRPERRRADLVGTRVAGFSSHRLLRPQ